MLGLGGLHVALLTRAYTGRSAFMPQLYAGRGGVAEHAHAELYQSVGVLPILAVLHPCPHVRLVLVLGGLRVRVCGGWVVVVVVGLVVCVGASS